MAFQTPNDMKKEYQHIFTMASNSAENLYILLHIIREIFASTDELDNESNEMLTSSTIKKMKLLMDQLILLKRIADGENSSGEPPTEQ